MATTPRILVLQHHPDEDPGMMKTFLAEDAIAWDAVELDHGEEIPDTDGYDALWAMGGPMDVWEEEAHPWFKPEKELIARWVADRGKPFLGVCLGHQLLADALGGEVGKSKVPEVGIMEVELTDAGCGSAFFSGIAPRIHALQWHSAEVIKAPEGAGILAQSPACAVQAMSIGSNALGIQYHVEITDETVPAWGAIPEYQAALERSLGEDGLERFKADASARMDAFARDARQLYDNFKTAAGWG